MNLPVLFILAHPDARIGVLRLAPQSDFVALELYDKGVLFLLVSRLLIFSFEKDS